MRQIAQILRTDTYGFPDGKGVQQNDWHDRRELEPWSTMNSGDVLLRGNKSAKEIGVQETSHWFTLYFKLTFVLAMALLLSASGSRLVHQVNMQILPNRGGMILLALIAYTLLMVIPFTPAIEVGIGLMLFMGSTGAAVAYVCTLIALSISFFIGRAVPRTGETQQLRRGHAGDIMG